MVKFASFILMLALITSCGGGGSEDKIPEKPAPILVTAGVDQTINENTSLSISGAASGGVGEYAYAWTADATLTIEHENTTSADAVLSVPSVTALTNYTVSLTVTDEEGKTGKNQFTLTVEPINLLPDAIIEVSQMTDYGDNKFPVGSLVNLDASTSFDEDAPSDMPQIAAYSWQQTAGTLVLSSSELTQSTLQFTTPVSDQEETITVAVMVTDQEGASSQATVDIILLGQASTIPDLAVGTDVSVFTGERIALSAVASSKAPRAAPFSVTWQSSVNNEGSVARIGASDQFNTYAEAPLVSQTQNMQMVATIKDSFGNTRSSAVSVMVEPQTNVSMNDTGVTAYATNNTVLASYQSDYAGQDADFGNDRMVLSGVADKTGRGAGGFDFTRLNENGDQVDNTALPWRCVRDNITGLVWEAKTLNDVNDIHHADHVYTWFQSEDNGNVAGELNTGAASCSVSNGQCNTEDFLNEVNSIGLCGFFDWRIPTHQELQSIVHYGKTTPPLADTDYFPFSGDSGSFPLWYWTNESSADGVSDSGAFNAWALDFKSGVDNFLNKSTMARVRLVRAGRVVIDE